MAEHVLVPRLERDRRVWAWGRIGQPEFDESNRLGDALLPGREDYSVAMAWTGLEPVPEADPDLWPGRLGTALQDVGGEGPRAGEIFVGIVSADGLIPAELDLIASGQARSGSGGEVELISGPMQDAARGREVPIG